LEARVEEKTEAFKLKIKKSVVLVQILLPWLGVPFCG
jgi:hypothetical protein